MDEKVAGLIGVGAMGRVLLNRLRKAGQRVQAFDIAEAGRDAARQGGAIVASSAAEAARGAAFIHVFVGTDDQVIETIAGETGILGGSSKGTLIFLHSTVLPDTIHRMAEITAQKGVDLIEAPIWGIPAVFSVGEGRFLVGGPEAVVARGRDQLMLLGQSADRFGGYGTASLVKIMKNFMFGAERTILNEVMQIVSAGGIDLRQFMDFEQKHFPERAVIGWEKGFALNGNQAKIGPHGNVFRKDIFLAADLADQYQVPAPIMHTTAETVKQLLAMWDKAAASKA